jgi:lysozyme family protein
MFTIASQLINAAKVILSPDSKFIQEHQSLFDSATLRPNRIIEIDSTLNKLVPQRNRYEKVVSVFNNGMPWWFPMMCHAMEAGAFAFPFNYHLHCGDSLENRTFHVPANRPKFNPGHGTKPPSQSNPYSWEESAIDALQEFGDHKETDWSVGACLWREEKFNGLGYRKYHPQVHTPYVWSYTNQYGDAPSIGKYTGDGKWDPNAISKQPGCAAYLIRLRDKYLL